MANLPSEDKVFPLSSRREQTSSRNMADTMSCGAAIRNERPTDAELSPKTVNKNKAERAVIR